MADTQSILKNFGQHGDPLVSDGRALHRRCLADRAWSARSFHVVLPVFVVPIIGFIFVIFFIYFTCKIWGWNFTF